MVGYNDFQLTELCHCQCWRLVPPLLQSPQIMGARRSEGPIKWIKIFMYLQLRSHILRPLKSEYLFYGRGPSTVSPGPWSSHISRGYILHLTDYLDIIWQARKIHMMQFCFIKRHILDWLGSGNHWKGHLQWAASNCVGRRAREMDKWSGSWSAL